LIPVNVTATAANVTGMAVYTVGAVLRMKETRRRM